VQLNGDAEDVDGSDEKEEETGKESTLPQHMPEGDSEPTSNDEHDKGKGKEGEGDFNEVPL
jgi:hypothetical protein